MQMARCKTRILFALISVSVLLCGVKPDLAPKMTSKPLHPDYQYPISYKDHVYTSLSDNARDLFFAVNIHPSCVAKKGQCIPRGRCIEKKMLYISRICYALDRVCCYSDYVKEPQVEHVTKYPPPTIIPNTESI
ncbi:uncharacterized protein LOC111358525 [Spodoptera litura]|uniref:Uncharacterized protein LOC111358525 n=1 Tax=Spodoptera litura TaxID=69820 RepID=A0A9J7EEC4_SPOLT|nr:uncharacterized protein LOC111358525 [Spodoptera litura]